MNWSEIGRQFGILFATITLSVGGSFTIGLFRQTKSPRPHNDIKLANECLTESYLASLTFLLLLVATGAIERESVWMYLHVISIALSFFFFVGGVYICIHMDDRIERKHGHPCRDAYCDEPLPAGLKKTTTVLFCIIFLLSSVLIFRASRVKSDIPKEQIVTLVQIRKTALTTSFLISKVGLTSPNPAAISSVVLVSDAGLITCWR